MIDTEKKKMKKNIQIQIDTINSAAQLYIETQLAAFYKRINEDGASCEFSWFSRLLGVKTQDEDILMFWEDEDGNIIESIVPFADIFGDLQ